MSGVRPVILATGEIYHVFNRGVERRNIFTCEREYRHVIDLIDYYRFSEVPMRFSQYQLLSKADRLTVYSGLKRKGLARVEIIAYCLMPNHFHFILRQVVDGGISDFISNVCNSHSRYFNIKHTRVGPLFQGPFKAVRVETEEQLTHLSRYVHLNPVTAFIINERSLDGYQWSSLPEYLSGKERVVSPDPIMSIFKVIEKYREFIHDNIDYAKTIAKVKYYAIDNE